ncbi:MAG: hypothetical protein EXS31_10585 [Pedosphaera sp.]|nr:hypothetical protein [Pedosphaera sp.]
MFHLRKRRWLCLSLAAGFALLGLALGPPMIHLIRVRLHEHFIPRAQAGGFLSELRNIIPKHGGDLLNVTVRDINTDHDTFLRYADQPVIAFVMFVNQSRTAAGDSQMESMTQEMIEAALRHQGRYYLPYRPHASVDQFYRAYPQAPAFFDLKRQFDPHEVFQNQFYVKYGRNKTGDR